jgi:hypothetical protein
MGKKKKSSSDAKKVRYRTNPLTGQREEVPGARSGRNKVYLPVGHPLRTHDLKGHPGKNKAD